MKNEKEKNVHLYPLGTFLEFEIAKTLTLLRYINLKFSAFVFSCVEDIECVQFQIPRYKSFRIGFFQISPLSLMLAMRCKTYLYTSVCLHFSRVVRKPAFCIFENKDADQLQRLCFRYIDSAILLVPKYEISSL